MPSLRSKRLLYGSLLIVVIGIVFGLFELRTRLFSQKNPQLPVFTDAIKVYVRETGIYSIDVADLVEQGMFKDAEEAASVQLYHQGRVQPVWIIGNGDGKELHFYGEPEISEYSQEGIYWLIAHSHIVNQLNWEVYGDTLPSNSSYLSKRIQPEKTNLLPSNAYYAIKHIEENLLYKPTVIEGDHWLWQKITSHGSVSLEFELTHILESYSYLHISIWSETEADVTPDHRIQILVNGQLVNDSSWDGSGFHDIEVDIPDGILVDGKNLITILSPGVEGVLVTIDNLDWIELVFPRAPIAENDRLFFQGTGKPLTLSGFSGKVELYVFDSSPVELHIDQIEPTSQKDKEVVVNTEAGKDYLVVGPKGYLKPLRLEFAQLEPDLRAIDYFGDYLVVGAQDLLEPLETLLALRQEQGLIPKQVLLQTIYDQFNFGYPEPIAIQRFIAYAFQHWNKPPQFLLLVGDASYDSIGYQAPVETNRLPTFLIQTISGGQTASDLPFGILTIQEESQIYSQKSLAPALAIGRIPANNASQVFTLVKKILAYENLIDAKKLPNSKSIVAVADGHGESFRSEAQKFLNQFNQTYSKQLYTPFPGTIGAEKEITELYADGHLILAYFGHGSIQMWGKDALFTIDGIKGLTKKSVIPYVLNFTCLTGLFNHPQVESIAEALLWKEEGGAIVVVAPTSLTLPVDQSQLSVALAQNLDNQNHRTIGEAFWDSQMSMTMKIPSERDVILTYLLFGDPALRLPLR